MEEKTYTFTSVIGSPWLKNTVRITDKFIYVHLAVRAGIVQRGYRESSISLHKINSLTIGSDVSIVMTGLASAMFVCGLFGMLFSESKIMAALIFIFSLLAALFIFAAGMHSILDIQSSSRNFEISVPFYEKKMLLQCKDDIENAIADEAASWRARKYKVYKKKDAVSIDADANK